MLLTNTYGLVFYFFKYNRLLEFHSLNNLPLKLGSVVDLSGNCVKLCVLA